MQLAITYAILALLAIVTNMAVQDLSVELYDGPFHVPFSVAAGTGAGLVAKYVLDKRFIYRFRATDALHDGRTFALYTLMGLATTAVFWCFEFGFDYVFGTRTMRYTGGVLGLVIGYFAKYHLDKRYVFRVAR